MITAEYTRKQYGNKRKEKKAMSKFPFYTIIVSHMLSRVEKEQRVIDLYQQGKTIREIAQEVHMSFGDIGSIIKKLTGLDGDNKPKQQDKIPVTTLSKDSQAFALFSDGKRPTEVAIKLDLGADVVDRLYQ